jgi:protease IV
VQSSVDHTYADFVAKVAAARRRTPQQIDAVAQGRVWTGAQAKERGLVDRLGSYGDALQAAARRGKLAGADSGEVRITYLDRDPGRLQRLVEFFGGTVLEALGSHIDGAWLSAGVPLATTREMQHELLWLAELTQQGRPFALAVHCLCGDP